MGCQLIPKQSPELTAKAILHNYAKIMATADMLTVNVHQAEKDPMTGEGCTHYKVVVQIEGTTPPVREQIIMLPCFHIIDGAARWRNELEERLMEELGERGDFPIRVSRN